MRGSLRKLNAGEFAGRGLVIEARSASVSFLARTLLGGGDDEAGDLGAGLGEHLSSARVRWLPGPSRSARWLSRSLLSAVCR